MIFVIIFCEKKKWIELAKTQSIDSLEGPEGRGEPLGNTVPKGLFVCLPNLGSTATILLTSTDLPKAA